MDFAFLLPKIMALSSNSQALHIQVAECFDPVFTESRLMVSRRGCILDALNQPIALRPGFPRWPFTVYPPKRLFSLRPRRGRGGLDLFLEARDQLAVGGHQRLFGFDLGDMALLRGEGWEGSRKPFSIRPKRRSL